MLLSCIAVGFNVADFLPPILAGGRTATPWDFRPYMFPVLGELSPEVVIPSM